MPDERMTAEREAQIRKSVAAQAEYFPDVRTAAAYDREVLLRELDATRRERDEARRDTDLLNDIERLMADLRRVPEAELGFSLQNRYGRDMVYATVLGPEDVFDGDDVRAALRAMLDGQADA